MAKRKKKLVVFFNLEAELARLRIKKPELADDIGLGRSTFYSKMNGSYDFYLREMEAIKEILEEKGGKPLTLDYLFSKEAE